MKKSIFDKLKKGMHIELYDGQQFGTIEFKIKEVGSDYILCKEEDGEYYYTISSIWRVKILKQEVRE